MTANPKHSPQDTAVKGTIGAFQDPLTILRFGQGRINSHPVVPERILHEDDEAYFDLVRRPSAINHELGVHSKPVWIVPVERSEEVCGKADRGP
jgi:hypothetical protein